MVKYVVKYVCPVTDRDRVYDFMGNNAKERALAHAETLRDSWNINTSVVCVREELVASFIYTVQS